MSRKHRIRKNSDAAPDVAATSGSEPRQVLDFREIGATGLRRFSGFLYDEFLPELTGWKGYAVYKEMASNDATIGAVLFAIKMLCRKVKWFVEAASPSEADQEASQFLESCMNDMSQTWTDTINEILSMLDYGFAVEEIVYKRRCGDSLDPAMRSDFADGRVGWRKLSIRAADTIYRWQFDEHGGIEGVEQIAPPHYNLVTIPVEKFLLFRTTTEKNNPEGRSILRTAYRCFSDDTEILTQAGWKFVREVTTADEVATLNRDSGAVEFESPSETQRYRHKGDMIAATSRYVDQLVTPDHRMWVSRADKDSCEFIAAQDCKPSVAFHSRGVWDAPEVDTFTIGDHVVKADAWLRFLGVWLAEGHSSRQKGYDCGEVGLTQKEGDKADVIREILAELPWSFSAVEEDDGMIRWRHYQKELWAELSVLGKARQKFIPRKYLAVSPRQAQLLLDAYYLGDGTCAGGYGYKDREYPGTKRVSTASDQLADDLMELALKCGFRAQKRWHVTEGFSGVAGHWQIVLGKHFDRGSRAAWKTIDYDGYVYCVTTRNGVVLSRRNGKATWSGNCWYNKKQIENIEAIGVERDLAGLPIAWVPPEILSPNASDKEKALLSAIKDLTINVRRNSQEGMVMPLDYDENGKQRFDFKLLSTGGSRQFDTTAIVNRYDQRIAMSVLADFVLLGQDKVGSFALASSKTNIFATAIGAYLDMIADVFNRYAIPRLFKLNDFQGLTRYPTLKHGDLGSVDLAQLGAYLQQLSAAGMPLFPNPDLERHMLEVAGLPTPVEAYDPATDMTVQAPRAGADEPPTVIPDTPATASNADGNQIVTPRVVN